ncbi:hypothetical protein [Desulfonatronum sp. SC1]|uniref:hypothetical protein n=1 Tax=Desulfonatronum sp. SC1 TaxID=2109626 RepID=UPI0011B1E313|nr:hypothetical protein [Desulfonatronum sp. SC1]
MSMTTLSSPAVSDACSSRKDKVWRVGGVLGHDDVNDYKKAERLFQAFQAWQLAGETLGS